jgi:hypothetical protein
VHNTEEYEKMVAKFQKAIALLRAIIIELLSRLDEKNQEKLIPITEKELDKKIDDNAKIIQRAYKTHIQKEKPKEMPANDIKPDFIFDNIKIYKLTENNYISILSLTNKTLWSRDIQTSFDQSEYIYNKVNIGNIYIIYITFKTIITPFLVSFVNNDLRDEANKQLKLYKFYIDIQNISSVEAIKQLREWFDKQIVNYVNPLKTGSTTESGGEVITSPRSGKISPTPGPTNYMADSCRKYNIIYRDSLSLDNYTILTIKDTGSEYDKISKQFGIIPFYIDIYDFISKFTNVTNIKIIGNFKIHFYDKKIISFNKINTLTCENVYLLNLKQIIELFNNLISITINYTNYKDAFTILKEHDAITIVNNIILLFSSFTKQEKLKTISLSKLFTLDNIKSNVPVKNPLTLNAFIDRFLGHVQTKQIELTYND